MRLLRHPQDRAPVALVSAIVVSQMVMFFAVRSNLVVCGLVLLLLPFQQLVRAVLHNHYHIRVFDRPILNRLYEVMLFLCTGLSPYLFVLHHNLGHHELYFDPIKDSLRWRWPDGRQMRKIEFLFVNTIGLYRFPLAMSARAPKVVRLFKAWLAACLALIGVFVIIHPVKALIIFIGPMLILLVDIIRLNWGHHVGLDATDHLMASRNDTTFLYNLLTFNNGFHSAHHVRPTLHWSELPTLHAELADRIPADLQKGWHYGLPTSYARNPVRDAEK